MAFVGRMLLSRIQHVQNTRVLSTALHWQQPPVVRVSQACMTTKAAIPADEGTQNSTYP